MKMHLDFVRNLESNNFQHNSVFYKDVEAEVEKMLNNLTPGCANRKWQVLDCAVLILFCIITG